MDLFKDIMILVVINVKTEELWLNQVPSQAIPDGLMHKFVPKIKCLNCPTSPNPEGLNLLRITFPVLKLAIQEGYDFEIFEEHLDHPSHRANVKARVHAQTTNQNLALQIPARQSLSSVSRFLNFGKAFPLFDSSLDFVWSLGSDWGDGVSKMGEGFDERWPQGGDGGDGM